MGEFPNNSLTDFTNILPYKIELDGAWMVALQSFSFHQNFDRNFEDEHDPDMPTLIKVCMDQIDTYDAPHEQHKELLTLPYEKSEEEYFYFEAKRKHFYPIINNNLSRIRIRILDEDNNRLNLVNGQPSLVKLKFVKMAKIGFILHVNSNDSLEYYPDNNSSQFKVQLPSPIILDQQGWEVALASIYYPLHMHNINQLKPHAILLYSSIVEPSMIGEVLAPILKFVPTIENTFGWGTGVYTVYESHHLDFIKLAANRLDRVDFKLKDMSGEDIRFQSDAPVIVCLIFRPVNSTV